MATLPLSPGPLPTATYRIRLNYSARQNDVNKQLGYVRRAGGRFDPESRTYTVTTESNESKVFVDWLIRRHHVVAELA
jgi:hypothetical protein